MAYLEHSIVGLDLTYVFLFFHFCVDFFPSKIHKYKPLKNVYVSVVCVYTYMCVCSCKLNFMTATSPCYL